MTRRTIVSSVIAAAAAMLSAQSALAGAHTWRVNEVFSTANGSIQFIELKESGGGAGEIFVTGLKVTSVSTGHFFTFPAQLVSPTSNKTLLLATQSFANLPGAPTPDYIIPANFFNQNGDTVTYNQGIYDTWTFGAVPTDCVSSLNRTAFTPTNPGVVAPNSPKNYAGQTGQVDACPPILGDLSGDGHVNGIDLAMMLGAWTGATAYTPCPRFASADLNHDCKVNGLDLAQLLGAWAP